MKYGVLFLMLSLLLTFYALTCGGWFLLLTWPAISFGFISLAYLTLGHRVFGKRPDGSMAFASVTILLPYLIYLWAVWHIYRLASREPAYNTLVDGVFIGRRLLSSELPTGTQTVVDLTSEFTEPRALRSVTNYVAAPMLDASVLPPQSLADLAAQISTAKTPVYIHCAQGHGRTGLVAALVLLARGDADNPEVAIEIIRSSRPLIGLNYIQHATLQAASKLIQHKA